MSENHEGLESVAETQPVEQADYFGFGGEDRFLFPDGVSFIDFRVMNEGQRKKFQTLTKRDVVMERRTGDTRVGLDPAEERHALLRAACVGWNLKRGGRTVPFNERALLDFLEFADPRLIDKLEAAIRKANPWLVGEASSEEIKEQIKQLEEMLVEAEKREAGEGVSSSK